MTIVFFIGVFMALIATASAVILQTIAVIAGTLTHTSWDFLLALFVALPLFLLGSMYLGSKKWYRYLPIFYTIGAIWLVALLFLFLASVLMVGMMLVFPVTLPWLIPIGLMLLGITLVIIVYGILRARKLHLTHYTITTSPLTDEWKRKKIIVISDIHLGIIWREKRMKKIVDQINAQSPDLVIIAGDIIDGPVFPYEQSLSQLKNIRSTFGTIFTPGNHDKYNQEPERWMPILREHTRVLIDEKVTLNGTDIIGLDYKMTETNEDIRARLTKADFNSTTPSIIILHDPKYAHIFHEMDIPLIISGHTHLGQFWPLKAIVKKMYKHYAYGLVRKNNSYHITSSGIGTALSPIRIGTKSEIVVIDFK